MALNSGRCTGGVAILARRHLGPAVPEWAAAAKQDGHLVAAQLSAPGGLELGIGCIYLGDSEGWSDANQATLELWANATASSHLPCVIGGDWNMTRSEAREQLHEFGFQTCGDESLESVATCIPR